MYCRTFYPNTNSSYSSFLFTRSDYNNTLNHHTCSSSPSYHDQISSPTITTQHRRRRRLEDPIITYASNYYATYPQQTLHSPPPSPQTTTTTIPSNRRIYQESHDKDTYCDLYNLLECPSSVKQRKKYILSDNNLRYHHRSIDYKDSHVKVSNISERKHHTKQQQQQQQQEQQQPSCFNDKKCQNNKLSLKEQYHKSQEKIKNNDRICQRHSPSKGFFRRVACNYFCMPITDTNGDISS
ncbi:unnamed protein product [Adineta steineri]|uniref:Uncharacterized protein n=1 Tax=Adineta steineri TaxID=433720 RepID=A0A815HPD0_9BILA|nr:unnamed protein product [Adineta steineri]CAF4016825.1 unnamed protein product [Adineta steineri]